MTSRYPGEPEYSCPKLDDAKHYVDKARDNLSSADDSIEYARKIHEQLREWGREQWERAEELAEELKEARKEIDEISALLLEAQEMLEASAMEGAA